MNKGQRKTEARKPEDYTKKAQEMREYVTKPSASVASATERWNEMLLKELANRVPPKKNLEIRHQTGY